MKRSVRWIMMGVVLAGLAWYVWHARRDLAIITRFDLRYLAPMLAVPVVSLWANGRIGKQLAAAFDVRLGEVESYALSTVNALGNYLPLPQAGTLARGVYLKRVHDFPYSTYAASIVVTYVSSLALYGVVGLVGLTVLAATGTIAPPPLWAVFVALGASVLMFTPLSARIPLPSRLAGFRQGLLELGDHHVLARVLVLQLALISLTSTGLWLACLALPGGQNVNWFAALMMGLLVMASGVANVTPGNLGVEQGAAMLTAHWLHIPQEIGFLASSLFRVMAIIIVFSFGPPLAHWLARQTPRAAISADSSSTTRTQPIETSAPSLHPPLDSTQRVTGSNA